MRPTNTFSIVARDATTGDLGVAVQSHWFSVGSIVTWAEPGVGAVATQAMADPSYGPKGLALMRNGVAPADAIRVQAPASSYAPLRPRSGEAYRAHGVRPDGARRQRSIPTK